ncbi:hypothetical protein BCR34DRAFT_437899, partial [Clohesyomyces aquaticus]
MSALTLALRSIFSATNENYVALANLKFDFSLIKMEAPVEFNGIVSALSARRRVEAEEGPAHKTARRLGALFEDLVPSTPKLISAYGLRVSEIMNTSGVNDIGTAQHGPFEPYIGVDGTSLWAAATSGISALGIYLLSCLLARAWDAKTATAIWVELVAARRKEIEDGLQNNYHISPSSIVGAYQDITRKDLQLWDSSARAWLRRADRAKEWSQCQLSLIVKNLNVPIPGGPSTYDKVIHVWKRSMLAMEHFLSGKPQDIIDGSVFLALSAWHLYPDLIVLGSEPTKVELKDKLIPPTGVGTVGVESRSSGRDGVQWSLALSHLQYYGDPVFVRSDQDYSRLTFAQLQIVTLGGLLGSWKVSPRDYLSVAEWFQPFDDAENGNSLDFGWLSHFVAASCALLRATNQEREQTLILLKHGSRRAKCFLSDRYCHSSPFFGLLNSITTSALYEKLDVDSGIAYLRAIAEKLGLAVDNGIICYAHNAAYMEVPTSIAYLELATARTGPSRPHSRWICPNPDVSNSRGGFQDDWPALAERVKYISGRGENCERYDAGRIYYESHESSSSFTWSNPPPMFLGDRWVSRNDDGDVIYRSKKVNPSISFDAIIGDWRLGLFYRQYTCEDTLQSYQGKAEVEIAKSEKASHAVQMLSDTKMVPARLRDYICSLIHVPGEHSKENSFKAPGVSLVSNAHRFRPDFSKSLYALDSASKIYGPLLNATISLMLIARLLCNSIWFNCLFKRWKPGVNERNYWFTEASLLTPLNPPMPDRHESFSCIALFDSGTVDLDPEDFENSFALCSEDTIYVPAVILSDPFTRVPDFEMKNFTGNIGRPGISILVPPHEPRIRELSYSYNLVTHADYDFKREDNFRETSLHLSFTDWTFPVATEGSRTIDHDAQVVEAVISVRDRGRWVADINILEVDFEDLTRFEPMTCCEGSHGQDHEFDYTSIDSWEELLDEPNSVGFFRAHGNWAARLAAVSIL